MGREVRRVRKDWEHPKEFHYGREQYRPLYEASRYQERMAEWDKYRETHSTEETIEWMGLPPSKEDYMPQWDESEKTHYMMYEDTSEGTPISPAFETPEELARWLTDTHASAFGDMTANYERWLRIAKGGWAPSMVISNGQMMSGVQAMDDVDKK